jgi:hypothetical protein
VRLRRYQRECRCVAVDRHIDDILAGVPWRFEFVNVRSDLAPGSPAVRTVAEAGRVGAAANATAIGSIDKRMAIESDFETETAAEEDDG